MIKTERITLSDINRIADAILACLNCSYDDYSFNNCDDENTTPDEVIYTCIRNGKCNGNRFGVPEYSKFTGESCIAFAPGTNIQIGDSLINPAGEEVLIVYTYTNFENNVPREMVAVVLSRYQLARCNPWQQFLLKHPDRASIMGALIIPVIACIIDKLIDCLL